MESNGDLMRQFSESSLLLARDKWKEVSLQFDEQRRDFREVWGKVYSEFRERPQSTPDAARSLIAEQPGTLGLTFAMARFDAVEVFPDFKRTLEFMLQATDRTSGYPAVAGIPHIEAGLLYMATAVMALHREAWGILEKLLTTKFEWLNHSDRPRFDYGFAMTNFFHSEALGRNASKIHDLFRTELSTPSCEAITELNDEGTLNTYLQVQMLMCLKGAQLCEQGEPIRMWADFGRFYGERVTPILHRASADDEFAKGMLRGFREHPKAFFQMLNERLVYIRGHFFRGSVYLYDSISSWESAR